MLPQDKEDQAPQPTVRFKRYDLLARLRLRPTRCTKGQRTAENLTQSHRLWPHKNLVCRRGLAQGLSLESAVYRQATVDRWPDHTVGSDMLC